MYVHFRKMNNAYTSCYLKVDVVINFSFFLLSKHFKTMSSKKFYMWRITYFLLLTLGYWFISWLRRIIRVNKCLKVISQIRVSSFQFYQLCHSLLSLQLWIYFCQYDPGWHALWPMLLCHWQILWYLRFLFGRNRGCLQIIKI